MDKSSVIFGNTQSASTVRKARAGQKKYLRKFGDDRENTYHLALSRNAVLDDLGTQNLVLADSPLEQLPKKPLIVGNIRMGFGHYRISMAMCSAARALGCEPLWLDLNSFSGTTGGKLIAAQNDLYSLGSRLSQSIPLFNKLVWDPMNYEGFRKLSYNAADQMNSELMTPIFADIPRDTPYIATHVWPAQAAVHAGMTHVVNAIPDNWQMGLHLSEGSIHTIQTPNSYFGYKTLRGMDKDKILKPMPDGAIKYVGHYIDHELLCELESDCERRIQRAESGKPLRYLLTVGGAGAQLELFAALIGKLMPLVQSGKAVLFLNVGDHETVLNALKKKVPALSEAVQHGDYGEIKEFSASALNSDVEGAHVFCSSDIFTAVYSTNLLMRACDLLVTKPSELAFYPVPKLFIKRVGGHEMWGAIHSAELGDGTYECDGIERALSFVDLFESDREGLVMMNECIKRQNSIGTYGGAYEAVRLACAGLPR